MLPTPSELLYFLEISRSENLSRAAERLGVSQPTLTQAVKRLEESLGQALLVRTRTGVKLTRAGKLLQARAQQLLDDWGRLRAEVSRASFELEGSYSLGCHPALALYCLPPILSILMTRHPNLELRLVHDLSRRVAEEVIRFRLDLGLVMNPPAHPDLVLRHVLDDSMRVWHHPQTAHPDALFYDPDLHQSQTVLDLLEREGIRFRRLLPSNSLEVIGALVQAGAGMGLLPDRIAARFPGIVPLDTPGCACLDRLYLIYRADTQRTLAHRTLVDAIGQALANAFRVGTPREADTP